MHNLEIFLKLIFEYSVWSPAHIKHVQVFSESYETRRQKKTFQAFLLHSCTHILVLNAKLKPVVDKHII